MAGAGGIGRVRARGGLAGLITLAAAGIIVAACQSDAGGVAGPSSVTSAPVASTPVTAAPSPTSTVPAVLAKGPEDLGRVCSGSRVGNAMPYDPTAAPRVFIALNTPGDATFAPSYTNAVRPFSVNALQWGSASVVACLSTAPGSAKPPLKCPYRKQDGTSVTITQIAYQVDVTFYAAATGQFLATGGRVDAPVDCADFMLYQTVVYGSPDEAALLAAIEKFIASRH
jgi:hypothetical protein